MVVLAVPPPLDWVVRGTESAREDQREWEKQEE